MAYANNVWIYFSEIRVMHSYFGKDFQMLLAVINQGEMSRAVRKPDFCICKNKDADQLRGNREADQRLCFRYTDSTIPLLSKSEILSL